MDICLLELSLHCRKKQILLIYRSLMYNVLTLFQINLVENWSQILQSIQKNQFVFVYAR